MCIDCTQRLLYPRCPSQSYEKLRHTHEAAAATLDTDDPMSEDVQTSRDNAISKSEWLNGGFLLLIFEHDEEWFKNE